MAQGAAPTNDGQFHGGFPSNLGQDNSAQEIQSSQALRDAPGSEEHMLAIDRPPSSSTKSPGKAIQAYDQEHDGAASSTKLIHKANADNMTLIDMDNPLKSTPVPKKNQLPQILSYLNDTRNHSSSRDEGREHDLRASNYGQDENTQTGESSTNGSSGVVHDGITSPCAAELAKATTAAPSSMESATQGIDDPTTEENVNSKGRPSSSTPSPVKAVQDGPGSEEHKLVIDRPPSSSTESRGKAIQEPVYDPEHDEAASSTTSIILKAIADAGPSVPAPAQHLDGVVAAIGGPAHSNARHVASNAAPPSAAIPAVAQHDVNVAIGAIGGGGGAGAGPAPAQPNAALRVPAPPRINGGGVAAIAVRPAPAQANAGGPAPNAAPPVPLLLPYLGFNNIDEWLTNSGIQPLRNPEDGNKGKIWDKLN